MDRQKVNSFLASKVEEDYIFLHDMLTKLVDQRCKLERVNNFGPALVAMAANQHDIYLIDRELESHPTLGG